MFKWFKAINEASNKWIVERAYKKKLAGRGPWVLYRCQKCWGCFLESDIIGSGKPGVCPVCKMNRFECAFPSFFENFKAVIRILFGKDLTEKTVKNEESQTKSTASDLVFKDRHE